MKRILIAAFAWLLCSCAVSAQGVSGQGPMVPTTPPGVQSNLTASAAPAVSNDNTQGYQVGSLWQNANTGQVWIARSVTTNAAVWVQLAPSGLLGYIAGNWYLPFGLEGTTFAGAAPGSGSIRLLPGFISERVTLSALGLRITTLSGGGNVQAAIYANNPATNRPTGTALASTASISTGATGSLNSAVAVQLNPGIYWFATNCDNGTAIFTTLNVGNVGIASRLGSSTQGTDLGTAQTFSGLSTTQTFGSWPDLTSATFAETLAQSTPLVQLQVGSVP